MSQQRNCPVVVGVDNGSTGGIAVLGIDVPYWIRMPVNRVRDYQVNKHYINRLDHITCKQELGKILHKVPKSKDVFVCLEPPMVNPFTFKATVSAVRCLEAFLVVLEQLDKEVHSLYYEFITAKQWQKELFVKLREEHGYSNGKHKIPKEKLKKWSLIVGRELYPDLVAQVFDGGKELEKDIPEDADALLLAHYKLQEVLSCK